MMKLGVPDLDLGLARIERRRVAEYLSAAMRGGCRLGCRRGGCRPRAARKTEADYGETQQRGHGG